MTSRRNRNGDYHDIWEGSPIKIHAVRRLRRGELLQATAAIDCT